MYDILNSISLKIADSRKRGVNFIEYYVQIVVS